MDAAAAGIADLAGVMRWLELAIWPLLRLGAMIMAAPIFGLGGVPARVRLLLSVTLTIAVLPVLPPIEVPALWSSAWFLGVIAELALGIALGFVLRIVFEAMAFAGELASLSVGLGFAQLADPLRGGSGAVLARLYLMIAAALFFAMDGHLALIQLTVDSFSQVAPGGARISAESAQAMALFGGRALLVGVRLALPVMLAMMVTNFAFGVIARAAPSLNLLTVGLPIALVMGMGLLIVVLPTVVAPFSGLLNEAWRLAESLYR